MKFSELGRGVLRGGPLSLVVSSIATASIATAQSLEGDVPLIDLAVGGTQVLTVDTGTPAFYLVLGSASGTAPGFGVPGTGLTLPLNFDAYTSLTLTGANQAPFGNTFGLTGANGQATATITVPVLVGVPDLDLFHAFVELDPVSAAVTGVSNAEPLLLRTQVGGFLGLDADQGLGGQVLTITGHGGFTVDVGDTPQDFCAVFVPEGAPTDLPQALIQDNWIGLDVIGVNAALNQILAQVPLWWGPADLGLVLGGAVHLAKGSGDVVSTPSAHPLLVKVSSGWVWEKTPDGPQAAGVFPFQLIALPAALPPPPGITPCEGAVRKALHGSIQPITAVFPPFGTVQAWCIEIPDGWASAGQYLNVRPRFWSNTPAPTIGYDAEIGCHHVDPSGSGPLSAAALAAALQTVITDTYLKHAPPLVVFAKTEPIVGGVRLCFYFPGPGGPFDTRDMTSGQFSMYLYN
jgi:hypothetical protein